MRRRPPRSTRTVTLFPDRSLCRSHGLGDGRAGTARRGTAVSGRDRYAAAREHEEPGTLHVFHEGRARRRGRSVRIGDGHVVGTAWTAPGHDLRPALRITDRPEGFILRVRNLRSDLLHRDASRRLRRCDPPRRSPGRLCPPSDRAESEHGVPGACRGPGSDTDGRRRPGRPVRGKSRGPMPVRTRTLLLWCCLATTALMAPDPSSAATETHNAITSVAAAVTSPDSSTFGRLIAWIFDQQRTLHREMAQDLRNLGSGGGEEIGRAHV